jgi:hypothetical protein
MGRAPRAGDPVSNAAYDMRANQHRPDDPAALAAEVRRMHADGLTARDISTVLRMPHDKIIMFLYGESEHERIREHR